MKTVAFVTVNRSDYGLYRSVMEKTIITKNLKPTFWVSGAHFSQKQGFSVNEIIHDRSPIGEKIRLSDVLDDPAGISQSMAEVTFRFSQAIKRKKPDFLVVLGDRFEMHAAAVAAIPFVIPIIHIHGGEVTEGAIDNSFRHSITKISHLHFTSTKEARERIIQMGEEPWRVIVSGAPGLDNVKTVQTFSPQELRQKFKLNFSEAPILVTYHSVTMEFQKTDFYVKQLLSALGHFKEPILFTAPNNDTAGRQVRKRIESFIKNHSNSMMVENLGTRGYFSVLKWARVMVGNSSSGILEAPSFQLPVVNIGRRQQGRLQAKNVINAPDRSIEIINAIKEGLSVSFRNSLKTLKNPYGDGNAAEKIVSVLSKVKVDQKLLLKKFYQVKL
ncbi:MAG: UDP-N-acetylglucosamine 2-epimerase [Elusimicrobiota bacterium]